MLPVAPPKKASGMNTDTRITVVPTTAPVIWLMALMVAALGGSPSSAMMRSTFSTTRMASSTTMPITSTMANMARMLIDMPAASITAKVPSSAMGTTMVGMTV